MGTKLQELRNGCFAKAMDDEPMFVLLARDTQAPDKVDAWADERELEIQQGKRPASDMAQVLEARQCATNMRAWRLANDGAWRASLFARHEQLVETVAKGMSEGLQAVPSAGAAMGESRDEMLRRGMLGRDA